MVACAEGILENTHQFLKIPSTVAYAKGISENTHQFLKISTVAYAEGILENTHILFQKNYQSQIA